MADDKRVEGQGLSGIPARASAKLTLSMDDLNASLDSFLVEPQQATRRGRVVAAADTYDLDCTEGATCNFKCGETAYWECGVTSVATGCDSAETCFSCVCTDGPYGDTGC